MLSGESVDLVSGGRHAISTCDIAIASCECADNSTLNAGRKQLRTSVRDGIGKSGTTGRLLTQYVTRFRPGLVVTENVPGFGNLQGNGHNNLKALVSGFAECPQRSCTAMSQILNAVEYGDLVSRRRLVAPTCLDCLDNTYSGLQALEPATALHALMLEVLRTEHPNISEYTLPQQLQIPGWRASHDSKIGHVPRQRLLSHGLVQKGAWLFLRGAIWRTQPMQCPQAV